MDDKKTLVDYFHMGFDPIKKPFAKIKGFFKFLSSTIGQIVGLIMLALTLVLLVYIAVKTIENAIVAKFFKDDFAGISTQEDYDVIVGSLSTSGYDAYISEEKWQEYAAFEYAVLMDVAEYLYQNQDYLVEAKSGDEVLYGDDGKALKTNAAFPEGVVFTQYDQDKVTKKWWQEAAVNGQGGSEYDVTSVNKDKKGVLGGNREVTTPRLIYETAINDYQDNAVSLMPYIMVVREDMELNYFLSDVDELNVTDWRNGVYGKNLEDINLTSLTATDNKLEPVRFSAELNRYNTSMPVSGYKEDLAEQHQNNDVLGVQDPEGFVKADRYDFESKGYGDDIYYTEQETDIVYKIPLKTLINRYLPKSTLLTTWYMLKPDEEAAFNIDDLMDEIKHIYNSACYQSDVGNKLKVVGYIDEDGNEVDRNIRQRKCTI